MIDPLFKVHKLNDTGIAKANEIALAFSELLDKLKTICPDSREFSTTKTNLEQAAFFAKRAMALVTDNQVPQDQYE